MENAIIVVILTAIVGGIVWYLWRARKRGEKCVGCPYAKGCGGKCNGGCGNEKQNKENEHQ